MLWVSGASGLLGANVVLEAESRALPTLGIYGKNPVHFEKATALCLNLNLGEGARSILDTRPKYVLHCAAMTNVDGCEDRPDDARRVNVELTGELARASATVGARFVYVSTDSVFDGRKGSYAETDATAPCNVYAQTKLGGEQAVAESMHDFVIARTNLYGWNVRDKNSLAEWVLAMLAAGKDVPGFTDVLFSPLFACDLAGMLLDLALGSYQGVLHLGSADGCSKFEFARKIAATFNEPVERIQPVSADSIAMKAPRPKNTTLDTRRAATVLGRPMPPIDDGIHQFAERKRSGYVSKLKSCNGSSR